MYSMGTRLTIAQMMEGIKCLRYRKVAPNTMEYWTIGDGGHLWRNVSLFRTVILSFLPETGCILIIPSGFSTPLTVHRINQFLEPFDFNVSRQKGVWVRWKGNRPIEQFDTLCAFHTDVEMEDMPED